MALDCRNCIERKDKTMGRPRKNPLPEGQAVADASAPVDAVATPPVQPAKKAKSLTKLYWMGALPKAGIFKYKRPSVEQTAILSASTEEFCTYEDATAQKLWDRWEVWSGKCKYAQNITVHGHEFVAFSCRPVMQKGDNNGQTTMIFDPWPGSVRRLTGEKLEAIIEHAKSTYQREENGKDAENNTALTVRFLNHDLINSRDSVIDKTGR